MVLVVKNLLANAGDTRDTGSVPGLGRPLEKEMAPHSSILVWRIPVGPYETVRKLLQHRDM